jgi:hypothetical protein
MTTTLLRQERQDAHVAVGVWIIFYAGSGLELKNVEKGKIMLPRDDFVHLRDKLVAVVNGKYTHTVYFASCFATAYFFICLPLSPALSVHILPLVFHPSFLLASRAASKKGQRSGRTQIGSRARRRQQRWRRRWQRRVGPSQALGYNRGATLLISCAFTGAAKVPGVHVHVKHI